jgi:Bacterial membrane protein YfhO
MNDLAPRMPKNFFAAPRVTLAVAGPNRIFHQAAWPVWGAHGPQLEGGDRTYWSQRTALFPFMPAMWGLRTIFEIDINLTTLRPTADLLQSLWEALRDGAPIRRFMMMGNAEYLIQPGRPIRIVRGPTLPRYWFADQIVPIRSREEFVRDLATKRWSDRVAFVDAQTRVSLPHGEVLSASESSHSATVRTEGEGLLVASVTPHRYWRATIDGKPAQPITVNIGLQGVVVPPGAHTIRFDYFNPLFAICGAISVLSLLISIMLMIYHDVNGRDQIVSDLP